MGAGRLKVGSVNHRHGATDDGGRVLALLALLSIGVGCAAEDTPRAGTAGASQGLTTLDGGGTADDGVDDGDDDGGVGDDNADGELFDLGNDDGVPEPDEPEDCAAVTQDANAVKQPADIIFVVDNSGSMSFEAQQIQANINAFSQQIIASGVDVRVVLISSYPNDGNGICVDAPLGAGGCPTMDTNPPTFTHVDERVGSHDAWERVLATHNEWANVMRPEASKHLVVVTDDTSNMPMIEFDAAFKALNPNYALYVHHSVVCHVNCPEAAGIGTNYINASNLTAGVASDLCDQDFQAVFDVLSTEVISGASLACEWEIPDPPDDAAFDPEAVNVEFSDGMGGGFSVGAVGGIDECPNVVDGWYYDNPADPALIRVCPQTCDKLQGFLMGTIDIIFGCATETAPPAG